MVACQLLAGGLHCPRAFTSQPALPSKGCSGVPQRPHLVVRASREDDLAQLASIRGSVADALKEKEASLKAGSSPSGAPADDSGGGGGGGGELADLRELTKDDFHSCLEEAGDQLVVVDFFTDWCGPCKVMYPMLCKMAAEQQDVTFVKLNCNKYNKELGKQLGVRVAPTFQLYKKSEKVAEMTGAKVEELQKLINEHK